MMKQSRALSLLLPFLFAGMLLGLGGCSVFASRPSTRHYYQIFYTPSSSDLSSFEEVVRVRGFDVDRVYRRHNIVYRSSPFELFYYNTHMWAVRPAEMMTDVLAKHLKESGLFKEVILQLEKRPAYEIRGRILALDDIVSEERRFARVSMQLTLIDFKTGEAVVTHLFDRRKEVFIQEPVYVVRALSEITEEEINIFMGKIDKALTD